MAFGDLVKKSFEDWVEPILVRRIAEKAGAQIWLTCAQQAMGAAPEIKEYFSPGFFQRAALRRYLINSFDPSKTFPCPDDFVLAIGIELMCPISELQDYASYIRKLANLFCLEWISRLYSMPLCRQYFEREKDVQLRELMKQQKQANPALDCLFTNRETLLRGYFNSYQLQDGADTVNVCIPHSNDTWIDRGISPTIPLRVLSAQKMELGFYRAGCDYFCKDWRQYLRFAYQDMTGKWEVGQFDNSTYPPNIDAIWCL